MKVNLKKFACVIMAIVAVLTIKAAEELEYCVLTSSEAGSLVLTPEAYSAENLKIVGDIDARDFKTLKYTTMNNTRVLDLSEARIQEYNGFGGCIEVKPGWIVNGNEGDASYEADQLPRHAFVEIRDNSLSKWFEGSATLHKIILPKTLRSIGPDAWFGCTALMEIETPEDSQYLKAEGNVVYTADMQTVVGIAPQHPEVINLHTLVQTIEPGVLKNISSECIQFNGIYPQYDSTDLPDVAYILSKSEGEVPEPWNNYPCFSELPLTVVNDATPGNLLEQLAEQGYNRGNVYNVKVSGKINGTDMKNLLSFPNLYIADLSDTEFDEDIPEKRIEISNKNLCHLQLPSKGHIPDLSLSMPRLCGDFIIPNGVFGMDFVGNTPISRLIGGNSLQAVWLGSKTLSYVDLSRCEAYEIFRDMFNNCYNLETVKLPSFVKEIYGSFINTPLHSLVLEEGIESIYGVEGWRVKELVFPSSLKTLKNFESMPDLEKVDFSRCSRLAEAQNVFNDCPKLKSVDFSECSFVSFLGLNSTYLFEEAQNTLEDQSTRSPLKIVIMGGSPYPARKWCGVSSVLFPSGISSIYGLNKSAFIKEMDLSYCYRLKELDIFENSPSLEKLILPPSEIKLNDLDMPVLKDVVCAGLNPPSFNQSPSQEFMTNITVTVPIGRKGHYSMDENWYLAKEILEGGYSVGIESGYPANIYGAGLYATGEKINLYAKDYINDGIIYTPKKWMDSENISDGVDWNYTVTGNESITVLFDEKEIPQPILSMENYPKIDNNANVTGSNIHFEADIICSNADYNDYMCLWIYNYELDIWKYIYKKVFLPAEQKTTVVFDVPVSDWAKEGKAYYVKLFNNNDDSFGPDNIGIFLYKAQHVTPIDENLIVDENLRDYIKTEIDQDGDGYLTELDFEINPIYSWDISGRKIRNLIGVENFPKLIWIDASYNELCAVDFTHNPDFELILLNGNKRTVSVDEDGWIDLKPLEKDGFNLEKANFSTNVLVENNRLWTENEIVYYEYPIRDMSSINVNFMWEINRGGVSLVESAIRDGATLTIYGMDGSVVAKEVNNISGLPAGFYIVVTDSHKATTIRVK